VPRYGGIAGLVARRDPDVAASTGAWLVTGAVLDASSPMSRQGLLRGWWLRLTVRVCLTAACALLWVARTLHRQGLVGPACMTNALRWSSAITYVGLQAWRQSLELVSRKRPAA
jgi:hypothetical protein